MPTPEVAVRLPKNWREIIKESRPEKREVFVSSAEVEEALAWLQKSRAIYSQVTRPARKGDSIEIDFEVSSRGKPIPGGAAKNHRLVIGGGGYLPGFEEKLEGMSWGEEKNFTLEAPDNYWSREIAGKQLDFHVRINSVQKVTLPEVNDDFARSLGKFGSLPELKENIRSGLRKEKEEREKERFRICLVERIAEKADVQFPPSLVDKELEGMITELKLETEGLGLAWPEYLKQIKKDEVGLKIELAKQAEKKVRYSLILGAIADEEKIEPLAAEVEEEVNKFLRHFSPPAEAEKSIDVAKLTQYTKGVLRNEKVFQFLEKLAA